MASTPGEVLLRRRLGAIMMEHRKMAGLTREGLGATSGLPSTTTIFNIETGRAATVKTGVILTLARHYGMTADQTDEVVELVEALGRRVTDQIGVSKQFSWYTDLESAAARFYAYEPLLIHGLLQTERYAEAIISSDTTLKPATIDSRVSFRLDRQRKTFNSRREIDLSIVLGEAALLLFVGSAEIMEEQIAHIREMSSRRDISYRPFKRGPIAAMNGSYTILEFDQSGGDPSVVYLETHAGLQFITKQDRVTEYLRVFDLLRSDSVPMEEYRP